MKFSTIAITLAMAVASTQAFSVEYSGSDIVERSFDGDDSLYVRSDILLDFTTRELVEELQSRLERREPVNIGSVLEKASGWAGKAKKMFGGGHHSGNKHHKHDQQASPSQADPSMSPVDDGSGGMGAGPTGMRRR